VGWLIVIALIVIPLIFKLRSNFKQNNAMEEILNSLEKHSPQDLAEIVKWEETLRLEFAKAQVLLDRGEITEDEFIVQSKLLLEKHREIEQKYNITEAEMVEYYQNYCNSPSYN
jgi:hypothetical protein